MIPRLIFSVVLCLILSMQASPQILKGTIKDTQGNPIPYATVYIRETQQGTVANTKGDYEIHLSEGSYTVIYQSLGYSPEIRNIKLGKTAITIDITLQVQYYQIPEIRITATGEDPAYSIMRKAIGLAKYHLNEVIYYSADVYMKGTLVINKIPKLLQRSMTTGSRNRRGSQGGSTIKEGETYLMESFNEIEFNAPDRYIQRVISSQSTFPEEGNQVSPMDFIKASFYEPVIAGMAISPLSPEAFAHYRFRYEGSTEQGDNTISKIRVTPKRKSQQLFEGVIYIVEDLWCIHSLSLVNENLAGTISIQQLFIPVKNDIWLPVSLKLEMDISIIGVLARATYGSSIKYRAVELNSGLQKPSGIAMSQSGKPPTQQIQSDTSSSKTRAQIESILSKGELSNRDMARLSKLIEKESKNSLPDSVRNSLEIKDRTTYIIEKDAGKKDSAFWASIRPIPLSETEAQSIRLASNLKTELAGSVRQADTTTEKTEKKRTKFLVHTKDISFGRSWSDTSGFSFSFDGLFRLKNLSFNTVDGFVYGTNFGITKRWHNSNSLSFYPEISYAFSREAFMWKLNSQYRFDRMHQAQVYLRSGMTSRDMGSAGGINTFLNSVTSLLLRKNYLKLYDSRYITLGHRRELINGLYIDISAGYDDRRVLENTTDFSIIKPNREYTTNIPDNYFLTLPGDPPPYELKDNRHYEASLSLQWVPRQRYRIRNNAKIPAGSDYPTITLTWRHFANRFTDGISTMRNYDHLRLEVSQRKETGAFSEFMWRFRTGGYIKNDNLTFFDFNHFNPQPLPILLNNYEDAFRLKDYYSLSTPEFFTEFHTKYTTPYLLLKLLPVLSNTLMRENVSVSFLWSDGNRAYTELGYSISELLFLGEAGIYAGFDNFSFSSAGFRIILKFN